MKAVKSRFICNKSVWWGSRQTNSFHSIKTLKFKGAVNRQRIVKKTGLQTHQVVRGTKRSPAADQPAWLEATSLAPRRLSGGDDDLGSGPALASGTCNRGGAPRDFWAREASRPLQRPRWQPFPPQQRPLLRPPGNKSKEPTSNTVLKTGNFDEEQFRI
jgi:hypothetical protein